MRSKSKKPAITNEWRENREAQERAEKEAARAASRAARAQALASFWKFIRHVLTSTGWIVALVLAVLLSAALFSYNPLDPGFSSTGQARPQNICGILGAWGADFLYWLLGRSAWWIAAFFFFAFVQLIRLIWSRRSDSGFTVRPVSSLLGLALLLSASVGLECLQLGYIARDLPLGAGGLFGQYVAAEITPYLGIWGSTFVLALLMTVGLSYAFSFSWLDAAEMIGRGIETGCVRVKKLFKRRPAEKVAAQEAPETVGFSEVSVSSETAPEEALPFDAPEQSDSLAETPAASESAPAKKPRAKTAAADVVERISPDLGLLDRPPADRKGITEETVELTSRLIESKLKSYRINASVVGAQVGPVITQYWLELAPGVKGSQVEEIRKDLTRALAVPSVRVVPVIPNQPYMGLEIPNGSAQRMAVYLSEIIGSKEFRESSATLSLALGKDISGKPMVINLAKLPHLLVGGTTGSGKSVCINTMILSLIYKSDPEHLRLVLIDPKSVEFSLYIDIPHLLCPVVTDMNKASQALNWLVQEMDHRYSLMSKLGVRSFESYNEKVSAAIKAGTPLMDPFDVTPEEPTPHVPLKPFAYIVCFIDELADLMLVNRKQVEAQIMRLAQKARAAGIHLVLATQRPSADIITPLIKANIVSRICFQVGSRIDSTVVLDEGGAQDLLGRGDMLFKRPGISAQRIQGCMVEEAEVLRVVERLKQLGAPDYVEGVLEGDAAASDAGGAAGGMRKGTESDPLYDEAVNMVLEQNRASTSYVQRRLNIGYNRAANLLEAMEAAGIVSKPNAAGKREILVKRDVGGF